MKRLPLALISLLLSVAHAQASTPVTLNWTARMQWANQSGPGSNAVYNSLPVATDANGWFDVSGRFVINRDAPPVQGFSSASGYWSADALARVEYSFGSYSFIWQNPAGVSSAAWGLSLLEEGSNDLISSANAALPYYGAMGASLSEGTAGAGLWTAPQNIGGYSIAMPTLGFSLAGADLLSTQQLAAEDFAKLSSLAFGPQSGGAPGAARSSLLVQFVAMPLGSADWSQQVNAHNVTGYFTSFSVSAVPEPASGVLALAGAGLLLLRRRAGAA